MNNESDITEHGVKTQTVVTFGTIFSAAINGIVGYIAVYFFRPIWLKTVKWWESDKSQN
jgi:hypothetical protein